jgi:hypothetical protein
MKGIVSLCRHKSLNAQYALYVQPPNPSYLILFRLISPVYEYLVSRDQAYGGLALARICSRCERLRNQARFGEILEMPLRRTLRLLGLEDLSSVYFIRI